MRPRGCETAPALLFGIDLPWEKRGDSAVCWVETQEQLAELQGHIARKGAEDPLIARIASRLEHANPLTHAERIHAFLRRTVRYREEPGERLCHPLDTLRNGYGDCDDMAIFAGALAIAAGRRAMMVNEVVDDAAHAFVEMWTQSGWARIDGTARWDIGGVLCDDC